MGALIEARDLTKLYGVVIGLNDLTLELEPGVHGLLGPNGAGKSTLLKLLTGMLRPSEGSLRVLGESPWGNPRLFRRIGYCPEQDAFWTFQTAREFVETLARMSGLSRDEARPAAERALARTGASEFQDRRIATYSKGMRQRTKLAQALAHEPELVILDEPLSGTDPAGRRAILDVIAELGAQGRSVIVSSHVMHEVEAVTQHFLLIFGGRVLAVGDVREVRALLAEIPHQLRIVCDEPRALAARLAAEPVVEGYRLEADGSELLVTTRDPERLLRGLPDHAEAAGVRVFELGASDESLDAVFAYLVRAGT
ncbi:MAG TPA: ABC transporter ATP-binding protein [Planctomycetota bacterium]|nr:ABC transporter ATP-binding protein [Planctomycetota bacterium]